MESLRRAELLTLILFAMVALTAASRRLLVPYPIVLVLGGLAIGLLPGMPDLRLDPDLVFLVFLPPILWSAAYGTSVRDFKAHIRPIALLALGLVVATTLAVGAVAHELLPGIGWPAALALGAIVSPPDVVAATAIARRLHVPRQVAVILEGESLVNDSSALILYRAAVAAAVTGRFELDATLLQFVFSAVAGVAIGLAVGAVTVGMLRRIDDNFSEIGLSLVAPYAAWVLSERAHASAVLACVAGGIYLRRHFSAVAVSATRVQARAIWEQLVFLLNGIIFTLIGLQVGALRETVFAGRLADLVRLGLVISAVAIGVRLLWVPLAAALPRWLIPALRRRDPMPPWSHFLLVGWTGFRGVVSLAAALALPLKTAEGAPFPYRDEIILITFVVILVTLVVQGLSLPPIIRALRLPEDTWFDREEARAREHAATAALVRLDELAGQPDVPQHLVERLRAAYAGRLRRLSNAEPGESEESEETSRVYQRLREQLIASEREALVELRDQEVISDDVLHHLEHELNLEAMHAPSLRRGAPPG